MKLNCERNSKKGEFVSLKNTRRTVMRFVIYTPNLLAKLCCNVEVEPDLQPLTSEQQIYEIKHGSFTAFIFAATGATGYAEFKL